MKNNVAQIKLITERLTCLKSSMSSSCNDPAGDGVVDSWWSGDLAPPPRLSPNWALRSEWSMVVSWLCPNRLWFMSFIGTSMVMEGELLKWEPTEWPRSYKKKIKKNSLSDVPIYTSLKILLHNKSSFSQAESMTINDHWQKLTTPRVELSSALPPDWLITPKLRCSMPWEDGFMKAEAKEGSFPPTTVLLARLFPTPGPLELSACSASSPKWASTSSMVSAESGSKEIGISNSSSPRQGVWNVFYNQKINA